MNKPFPALQENNRRKFKLEFEVCSCIPSVEYFLSLRVYILYMDTICNLPVFFPWMYNGWKWLRLLSDKKRNEDLMKIYVYPFFGGAEFGVLFEGMTSLFCNFKIIISISLFWDFIHDILLSIFTNKQKNKNLNRKYPFCAKNDPDSINIANFFCTLVPCIR